MKGRLALGLLISALPVFASAAACPTGGGQITDTSTPSISTKLTGQTVCGISDQNTDRWQEYHDGSGTVTEYALGSDPVDPTHVVGSWSTSGSTVTYTYTGGGSYSFTLFQDGTSTNKVYFCDATGSTLVATATLMTGQVSCGY